ncbi:MAG: hypothetical protein QOF48_3293 [Verrucomicrobiota bacterium]|jgi:hypothetical protein
MLTRTHSLALLLLVVALPRAAAQELVVVVESPAFILNTRLSSGSALSGLVVMAESAAFTLNTRLSPASEFAGLVLAAASPTFTLDTRLAAGNPTLAALVVSTESGAFILNTRQAARLEALIVEAVSPAFSLNTMWIGIRRTARASGTPVELYWPTNAPGFYPQSAPPPLRPSMMWQNMTNAVGESGGFYRALLSPEGTERYFRLKL